MSLERKIEVHSPAAERLFSNSLSGVLGSAARFERGGEGGVAVFPGGPWSSGMGIPIGIGGGGGGGAVPFPGAASPLGIGMGGGGSGAVSFPGGLRPLASGIGIGIAIGIGIGGAVGGAVPFPAAPGAGGTLIASG